MDPRSWGGKNPREAFDCPQGNWRLLKQWLKDWKPSSTFDKLTELGAKISSSGAAGEKETW